MVLTDAISKAGAKIQLFTLATGWLHQETIDMVKTTENKYQISIEKIYPQESDVQAFVDQYGMNGFYDGEEPKKACCGARKRSNHSMKRYWVLMPGLPAKDVNNRHTYGTQF